MTAKKPSLFILLILVSFASVSAVLFTPALPEIAKQLQIDEAAAQMSITIFVIGYALGLLPYGPLSDRFGRKPPIYLGILIAIAGCFLILLTQKFPSYSLFLLGRLLMALGSSVGLKISFTMVGDIYEGAKAIKMISYLMLSFAVAPALAIGVGGFLTTYFGWASCFYFQAIYSLFVLSLSFYLPETCQKTDPQGLNLKIIGENYLKKIKKTKLIICALLMGCGSSVIYLFAAEAPFIGIEHIGLSPDHYGLLNLIPPVGLVLGSVLANLLSTKMAPYTAMWLGGISAFLVTLIVFFLFSIGHINAWTLFVPMPFIYIGESLVYANASSLILTHAQNKSYASATMGFITMGSCAITLLISGKIPLPGTTLMPMLFTAISILMLLLLLQLRLLVKRVSTK